MASEFKLSYTASEVNARLGRIDDLAKKSEVPSKMSELKNDSGFVTGSYVDSAVSSIESNLNDYALNSKVDRVRQEVITASNAYTDEQIESVLIYVNNMDIDALF